MTRFGRRTTAATDPPAYASAQEARADFVRNLPSLCEVCAYEPKVVSDWDRTGYAQFDIHHIVPQREGGSHFYGNLALLCANCHRLADALWADGGAPRHRSEFLQEYRLMRRDPDRFVAIQTKRAHNARHTMVPEVAR
jgi:5-methylcytosine-specific restriction endonuclease McrA